MTAHEPANCFTNIYMSEKDACFVVVCPSPSQDAVHASAELV